ncbi:dienelactone hydrolase family protein [Jannaschia donghaensis]|uniref:Putative dienelactone hydrolase n=1 Tax=Jannaschia donghaensis TaxID=420998 RepID=A0A0M6YFE1_9RHOB|nr:dienelactone hydrolase family protein [Jannaschia donghaensis]CTQ48670.1 putative dienelactone hydrolase [Jannaschia donghaensis]
MGAPYEYACDGQRLVGYRADPDAPNGAGLLIAPAFFGLRDFEMAQADLWAARGYAVLAVDYYGDGWRSDDSAAAAVRMADVEADRATFLARMQAALDEVKGWGAARVGAVGYCLGGKAVLDLGRSGQGDAIVGMHAVFDAPPTPTTDMPPVLLCHGWADPLATPAQFGVMVAELEAHCADWHALCLGRTEHAFTNPGRPAGYVERSARRSFVAAEAFLAEKLL